MICMKLEWKNIDDSHEDIIQSWLTDDDKTNLCLNDKSWNYVANDIYRYLKLMHNYQFRNVIGHVDGEPVVAIMCGVEDFGNVLNIYDIVTNPKFRGKNIAKYVVTDIAQDNNGLDLVKTYRTIRASCVPNNTVAENLFKRLDFDYIGFDGEYNVYEKQLSKSSTDELIK